MQSVVLPPNLHLLTLSIPGWNFSSNHSVHLSHINSGHLGDKPVMFFLFYQWLRNKTFIFLHDLPAGKDFHSEPDYNRVLMRIMHLFEEGEDPELSKPVTINMKVLTNIPKF